MRELLGDKYSFDPTLSDEAAEGGLSEVDQHVLNYYLTILVNRITGLSDSSVIPALNFVPTRVNNNGKIVSNTANITTVTNAMKAKINAALTGSGGVLSKVENGNYNLDDLFTDDQWKALIDECKTIIDESAKKADTKVEYATPETLEADLRAYAEALYYQKALEKILPDVSTTALHIMKVSSVTDDSLEMLVEEFVANYNGEDTSEAAIYLALMNDENVLASVDTIAAMLNESYGDVKAQLMKALSILTADAILGKKAPALNLDLPNKADEENPVTLKEAIAKVDEIISEGLAAAKSVDDILADVTAYLADFTFDEGKDGVAQTRNYVYYAYLADLAEHTFDSYYYDVQLGKADAEVRAGVTALYNKLVADMPANSTVYDIYDVVLDALTNKEYNVAGLTAEIAAKITHHVDGNNDLTEDVLNYFCYLLLNSFEGYELGDEAPSIESIESGKLKNALKQIDKSLNAKINDLVLEIKSNTARGAISNYALSAIMTDEELTALCNAEVTSLIDALFAEEDVRETLRAELEELFKYKFYTKALDELGADKKPSFHVSEIYGDDLYTAGQGLKSLLRWYVVQYAQAMTDEEIDNLIGKTSSTIEEEEQDESKYLSDDGRIVAVTYGSANANGGYDNYRTFVLNYNNFSVSVIYDGVQYTIPAYSYVVIDY